MTGVWEGSADKLQAALNHDFADPDKDLPPGYLKACREWFMNLTMDHSVAAAQAIGKFNKGDEAGATQLVVTLPSTPAFPL